VLLYFTDAADARRFADAAARGDVATRSGPGERWRPTRTTGPVVVYPGPETRAGPASDDTWKGPPTRDDVR
jgi:hypothetical protein